MLGVVLLSAGAHASAMTGKELASWVTGVEQDHGCAVAVAVPAGSAGDARAAVQAVARVIAVREEDWDDWKPEEAAAQGRCVVRARERTPGMWDAEFVGLAPVTAESRPHVDIARTGVELVGGAAAGVVGWFVGDLIGLAADPACVNPTGGYCSLNVGEAIGSGVATGLAAGTTEWAIAGIGRVHSSLPWALAGSTLGVAGGTSVLAISSQPGREAAGQVLQLAGAPIGATVGVASSARYDRDHLTAPPAP